MGNCACCISAHYYHSKYCFTINQGRALKKYVDTLKIPTTLLNQAFRIYSESPLDIEDEFIDKKEFLGICDVSLNFVHVYEACVQILYHYIFSLSSFFFFFFTNTYSWSNNSLP
jgi:hypothetical protein